MIVRGRIPVLSLVLALVAPWSLNVPHAAMGVEFDRVVIDNDFPGAYQVEVADVNGDKRPDVVAVGGGTCAWYENPSWKKRVVTGPKQTPGIISSATADLDGDGKAEIAIAYEFEMNEPKKGKLLLATQGKNPETDWTTTPIADVGSIHRLRWGTFPSYFDPHSISKPPQVEKRTALVVAPIFGPSARPPAFDQEPAHVALWFPANQAKSGQWLSTRCGEAPVLHAIDVIEDEGYSKVYGASNLGVTLFTGVMTFSGSPIYGAANLAPGAPGHAPKKGASEVHTGKLKDGRRFLATVEPWHGTDVAVYLSDAPKSMKFGPRNVIDTTLKEGHALWVADVDGDGDSEIFAGYRGSGTSVVMYDHNGKTWDRTVIDASIAAQDLRGGDIDGDGRPDVVAVGGSTHNVVWYRPKK